MKNPAMAECTEKDDSVDKEKAGYHRKPIFFSAFTPGVAVF
ncbi:MULTISPECIES: hypothetical protein [Chryseobacterium]|uniref:Uncharacterized protein n=1 Tax=Chryseobacterium endophyticum TaxID=1854762 RepID=A0AAU6WM13_9FLAO|nr:hypothetical protein [uncultured Chryseobacterium sp.]